MISNSKLPSPRSCYNLLRKCLTGNNFDVARDILSDMCRLQIDKVNIKLAFNYCLLNVALLEQTSVLVDMLLLAKQHAVTILAMISRHAQYVYFLLFCCLIVPLTTLFYF